MEIVIGDHFDPFKLNQELQILLNRSSELINLATGIHLTDSVLGIPVARLINSDDLFNKICNS